MFAKRPFTLASLRDLFPSMQEGDLKFGLTDYAVIYIATFGAVWTVFSHLMTLSGQTFTTYSAAAPGAFLTIFLVMVGIYRWLDRGESWQYLKSIGRGPHLNFYVFFSILISYGIILFVSFWDLDEVFYANLAVSALENPDLPLMKFDGMHGYPGIPVLYPTYVLHAFELLSAYLGKIFGSDPLFILHIILPCVYNVLTLIAWYKLLDYFFPKYKYPGLLFFTLMGVFLFGANDSPGANQFLRLYQGKTVVGLVILPLLMYYSARFMSTGDRRVWYILFVLNIFALGLSSTTLFLNILLLGGMSLVMWSPTHRQTYLAGLSVMSASYVLAMGIYMKTTAYWPKTGKSEFDDLDSFGIIPYVFGVAHGGLILLGCLSVWFLDAGQVRNRILRLFPVFALSLILIPPVADLLAKHITSNAIFWRVAWLLPINLYLFAFMLSLKKLSTERRRAIIFVWVTVLLIGAVMTDSYRGGLSWPGRKVDRDYYRIASDAHLYTPPGTLVLGPEVIVMYLPWMSPTVKMVGVRDFYMDVMRQPFGEEESSARRALMDIVKGDVEYDKDLFRKWVPRLNVGEVIVKTEDEGTALHQEMVGDLYQMGFSPAPSLYQNDCCTYRIFVKEQP